MDQQQAQKKAYVQTTFIPNESQQFVPQKKINFPNVSTNITIIGLILNESS